MPKKSNEQKTVKTKKTEEENKLVESKVEEAPKAEPEKVEANEAKKEETIIKLEKLDLEGEAFAEAIENERKELMVLYKKEKNLSRISMIVAVAIIAVAIIILTVNVPGARIISFVLAGVVLVGLVVYYALTKNRFPNATREYITKVGTLFNRSSYGISDLKDATFNPKEKVQLNDILAERVYNPINEISSRNVVHATYLKSPITFSDLALYVPGEKKGTKQVAYLGKHITFTNDLHFEGRYIIQLRTAENKPTDTPTDIADLVVRFGGADYTVYGVEKSDYKKDIGQIQRIKVQLRNSKKFFKINGISFRYIIRISIKIIN